ncbi:hypothetical protein MAR_035295 [Mya arenaria]|uniref:Ubiquitin-like domain-containing protein n=1 Tax=Mya arenaria TaxID=6604 RepID=A0ABY7EP97_MYAAR|nr:hypothetical protein MAR_035295 [Mya arenaria]
MKYETRRNGVAMGPRRGLGVVWGPPQIARAHYGNNFIPSEPHVASFSYVEKNGHAQFLVCNDLSRLLPGWCVSGYKCTIKSVEDSSTCPYPECGSSVKLTDNKPQYFQAILDDLFKEYAVDDDDDTDVNGGATHFSLGGTLTISLLTGESMAIPFTPSMEILQLKAKIMNQLKHDTNKQKLLYKDTELTSYQSNGAHSKLSDFAVKPNSTIQLVVLLFAIPDNFNHVVFDLFWGYPSSGPDYLDATCLTFQGTYFLRYCDYRNRAYISALSHSGDVMDDRNRQGHHTIQVKLKEIPPNISHLFFTLSAYNSPNISRYPNPSLRFYEAANPSKNLCKTTFHHAGASQAVVMCSMSRNATGGWEIFKSGKLSSGNAKNYAPLTTTIRSLITQGF